LDWLVCGDASSMIFGAAAVSPAAPNADAALVTLGEKLKAASAEVARLKPDRRLYEACWKASGFDKKPKGRAAAAAERKFRAMAEKNGYDAACKKWNAVDRVESEIAKAILRMPSQTRVGDGVRAAATIVDGEGIDATEVDILWEMAVRAGFPAPASMT
jgi:hypothetical protein